VLLCFVMIRLHPSSPLFPYTTLFRSFNPATGAVVSKSRWLGTLDASPASGPLIARSTSIASSTVLVIGPSLSSDQQSVIAPVRRSEEHTSELQSRENLVCRLLLEKTN